MPIKNALSRAASSVIRGKIAKTYPLIVSQPPAKLGKALGGARLLLAAGLLATGAVACNGTIGDGSSGGLGGLGGGNPDRYEPDQQGDGVLESSRNQCAKLGAGIHPGESPIRRLTKYEYNRTVQDIFDITTEPANEFPPEAKALGFAEIADAQTVTVLLAESYWNSSKDLALGPTADLTKLLGCEVSSAGCVDSFITKFGRIVYRRPVADAELLRFKAVYDWGQQKLSAREGVQMMIEVMLQSPDFLYRPEFGESNSAGDIVPLSSYEIPPRLSYLMHGSMPDESLRAAADDDQLKNKEEIYAQAKRLLDQERTRSTYQHFFGQWLALEDVGHIERDATVYPGWTANTPKLLREETESFVDHVIFDGDGSFKTLLTAPYTFMNKELADFYGVSGPSGSEFEKVNTDPTQRAGLLTHGSLLAHHAQALQTSPVHRGKFIRETVLCQTLAPPPDDIIIVPPDLDPNLTTRERFSAHSDDPKCAGCHFLLDPVGLGFEHYDAVGRWRDEENGKAIDATGELFNTDVDGKYSGGVELATKLSESDDVSSCAVKNWVRYAYGRSESPEDACSLVDLGLAFSKADFSVHELLLQLTQTDAFLYRKAVTP